MHIQNSTQSDLKSIFQLYDLATEYQKSQICVVWPKFDESLILQEIKENRQFKLIINEKIACIWAITFDDPQIWGKKNADPSIFIHRIATNPLFRGQNMVMKIVAWAKEFALTNNKKYIRLDTIANNQSLIKHYTRSGFDYLGDVQLTETSDLPQHYKNAKVSLFEIML